MSVIGVYAQDQKCITSCDTAVWFVNFYPGSEIYELEGHSALRLKWDSVDVAVNYGMFSFEQPNFVYRFVKGETDYAVGLIDWQRFVNQYIYEGRRVVAHRLILSREQTQRLMDLVAHNLEPENRVYRYNYVLDNCATRPLRTVELAIGDSIILDNPSEVSGLNTFRDIMRNYHRNYPWYQFGIDVALGNGIDRPITLREKSFAPVVLDKQLLRASLKSPEGSKLVQETIVLNDTDPIGAIDGPTSWWLTPVFLMWFVALVVSGYSIYIVFRRKRFPRLLVSIWFGVSGLAGILVAFLVFISVHESTSPNYNLLWLNPLCFLPVFTIWIKNAKKLNFWYFLFNFVCLLVLICVWLFGVQSPNPAFVPIVLTEMLLSGLYVYFIRKGNENSKIE